MKALLLSSCVITAACNRGDAEHNGDTAVVSGDRPEVLPVMLNSELPFRYPPSLYSRRLQANVMLRVYINEQGQVVQDSVRIVESSGISAMDSAAVTGAHELRFEPAKMRDSAVPVSILFPVYFRHPDAPPLPGDSILKGRATATNAPAAAATRSDTGNPGGRTKAPARNR